MIIAGTHGSRESLGGELLDRRNRAESQWDRRDLSFHSGRSLFVKSRAKREIHIIIGMLVSDPRLVLDDMDPSLGIQKKQMAR